MVDYVSRKEKLLQNGINLVSFLTNNVFYIQDITIFEIILSLKALLSRKVMNWRKRKMSMVDS